MHFIRTLARKGEDLARALDRAPVVGRVIAGDASLSEYGSFLRGTYQYVCWSSQLLCRTAEGLQRCGRHEALVELLMAKSAEESQHDRWLLEDAERCGIGAESIRGAEPSIAVDAYVTWSRALAAAGSPAYLGAAYVLESISQLRAGEAAACLRARAQIPGIADAVSFLSGHGEADVAHIATLERVLATIACPVDQAEVLVAADVLATLYPRFFPTAL